MRIPFINIADTNCWMVYLMPFNSGDRTNYELIDEFQQNCIKEKVFGMGWDAECFAFGTPMTEENAAKYVYVYNHQEKDQKWFVSESAVKGYKSIKEGDYIITRLKNSHYYVGRVISPGITYMYKPDDPVYGVFSWGGHVDEWVEYENGTDIPSEIEGRFSQRRHSSIQRIDPYRQKLLVIAMYENKTGKDKRFNVPKLRIGINNFVRSMNYMELEDLVAIHISDKHWQQGYRLLPSSCKISQQNYEYRFVAQGKKPITCQVKNQQDIEIKHYLNETSYERIYIFSGKWSDSYVDSLRKEYEKYEHIAIVSPSELYRVLKNNNIFGGDFYDFENESVPADKLPLDGYNICKKPNGEKDCSISDDKEWACFLRKDGLFYSAEFGALVLSWHVVDDHEYEMNCIKKILADINVDK